MNEDIFTYKGKDNKGIVCYKWLPGEEIRAVVQIVHGMSEHAARYKRFAEKLGEAGFAVYANDHRGHGRTAGDIEKLGHFADNFGWDLVIDDLHRLTEIIKKITPIVRFFFLDIQWDHFLPGTISSNIRRILRAQYFQDHQAIRDYLEILVY